MNKSTDDKGDGGDSSDPSTNQAGAVGGDQQPAQIAFPSDHLQRLLTSQSESMNSSSERVRGNAVNSAGDSALRKRRRVAASELVSTPSDTSNLGAPEANLTVIAAHNLNRPNQDAQPGQPSSNAPSNGGSEIMGARGSQPGQQAIVQAPVSFLPAVPSYQLQHLLMQQQINQLSPSQQASLQQQLQQQIQQQQLLFMQQQMLLQQQQQQMSTGDLGMMGQPGQQFSSAQPPSLFPQQQAFLAQSPHLQNLGFPVQDLSSLGQQFANPQMLSSDLFGGAQAAVNSVPAQMNATGASAEARNTNGNSRLIPNASIGAGTNSSVSGSAVAQLTGRKPVLLYMACDADALSDYQCLVRKQIELFEADFRDTESSAQGRNKPIVLGQVGIRCRYCTMLPPKHRARGAIYYPAKLEGLYQAAQNQANSHLAEHCNHVPPQIREELIRLKDRKSSPGGGKLYWAEGVRALGVFEDANGLRFSSQ